MTAYSIALVGAAFFAIWYLLEVAIGGLIEGYRWARMFWPSEPAPAPCPAAGRATRARFIVEGQCDTCGRRHELALSDYRAGADRRG